MIPISIFEYLFILCTYKNYNNIENNNNDAIISVAKSFVKKH